MTSGLSIRAYADHRRALGLPGGNKNSVTKALNAGRISRNRYGKIDPDQADADWTANTDPTKGKPVAAGQVGPVQAGGPRHAAGGTRENQHDERLDLTYERARLAKAQADKVELDNAERAGRLVDMDAAVRVFSGQVMTAKNRLLGMGAKLASELCGAAGVTVSKAPAMQQVVENEVREILEELSVDAACNELRDGGGSGD